MNYVHLYKCVGIGTLKNIGEMESALERMRKYAGADEQEAFGELNSSVQNLRQAAERMASGQRNYQSKK